MRLLLCGLGLGVALSACAQRAWVPPADAPATAAPAARAEEKHPAPVPHDVVHDAAAAFVGLRVDGGELLAPEDLLDELSHADLICVGEQHGNARTHYAQWVVLTALAERSAMSGRSVGLGLEMLPRSEQHHLDQYASFDLDEHEFLEDARWSEGWGFDFSYYRPQLEFARHKGISMVALNARRSLTRAVARGGIDGLSDADHKELPALDLHDAEHRAWFDHSMKDHPHGKPEHLYAAQVVWDETMAETASRWLAGRIPGRQLVVLAGTGHCRADAIPNRVRRRSSAQVISVRAGSMGEAAAKHGEWDFVMVFE